MDLKLLIVMYLRLCTSVLQSTKTELNCAVLANSYPSLFQLLRKEYTNEAIPVSHNKGVKYPGFLLACFIGPGPDDLDTIAMPKSLSAAIA